MKKLFKILSLTAVLSLALTAVADETPPADAPDAPEAPEAVSAQDAEQDAAEAKARAEVYAYLRECPAFFLATVDEAQGDKAVPRVRPFGALALWDDAIYIQTGNFKPVYRQLIAAPRIEICALQPSGDKWIRIGAHAILDPRREAVTAVLDANPELRSLYSEDDGRAVVFRLENVIATFYSFTANPTTVQF